MKDRDCAAKAAGQYNRVSRAQLEELGWSERAIEHRLACGRLVLVETGVYAMPPVLEDPWGRWMGATLTAPDTYLALWSAAVAYGWLSSERPLVSVMRPGRAGPRRHGGILVFRRPDLEGEVGTLHGLPITSPERTLLDLAPYLSVAALSRALREAVRLEHTTIERVLGFLLAHPRRRGARKLTRCASRYTGLPLERARSGAEVRALLVLRDGGHEIPQLNVKVAGIEADLVWRRHRRIVEIDGGPFHLDVGEDARKEATWRAARHTVSRISSDEVYARPELLRSLSPPPSVVKRTRGRGAR